MSFVDSESQVQGNIGNTVDKVLFAMHALFFWGGEGDSLLVLRLSKEEKTGHFATPFLNSPHLLFHPAIHVPPWFVSNNRASTKFAGMTR